MLVSLALALTIQVTPAALAAPDITPGGDFGSSLSLAGDVLVIGAPGDQTGGPSAGSVHVFRRSAVSGDWAREGLFRGAAGDWLGAVVEVAGDRVAMTRDLYHAADVRILERSGGTWSQVAVLVDPDSSGNNANFGRSLSIEGDRIAVGCPGALTGTGATGAVYVFERGAAGWALIQRVLPAASPGSGQIPSNTSFGWKVQLTGDLLAIGAPRADVNGVPNAGEVTLYRDSGAQFLLEQTVPSPNLRGGVDFGRGLGLDGGRLVVASAQTTVNGVLRAGMVHTYLATGTVWTEAARLPDPDPSVSGSFGTTIKLDSDRLCVARYWQPRQYSNAGPLEVESFHWVGGQWQRGAPLQSPHDAVDTRFGSSLDLDGDVVAVGASGTSVNGDTSGGTYVGAAAQSWSPVASVVCSFAPCGCPPINRFQGCGNGRQLYAQFSAFGSASIGADDLQFSAARLTPNVLARLALGPGLVPARPAGDGALCINSPNFLAPGMTTPQGGVSIPGGVLGRAGAQLGAAGVVLAGESWVFQVMYDEPRAVFGCRSFDANVGQGVLNGRPYLTQRGFNFTTGLLVTFVP